MTTLATKKQPKTAQNYECANCDFVTCKISNYKQHLATDKHKNNVLATNGNKKTAQPTTYTCGICHRDFTSRSGLWRHNKSCQVDTNVVETNNEIVPSSVLIVAMLQLTTNK